MGGSFAGFRLIEELISLFPIDESEATVTDSHPVVPSRQVLAIVRDQGKNRLKRLHWGLVPFWAKDTGMGPRLINAHAIYLSCAIITTAASRSVAPVHHRMPVILDPGAYTTWLNPENRDTRALETILKTDIIGELTHRPASRRVNATEVNTPDHIRPMAQMEIDFKSFD